MMFKIGIVKYDLHKIVDEFIAPEFRESAKTIITEYALLDEPTVYKNIVEFIIYSINDMGNQVCCQIDYMKSELVKVGKMEKGGPFGRPFEDLI